MEDDQRRQLGAFLRARREALDPGLAGLASLGRRRTPGLRREEVALLSGISTTWYTWLEQAREIALSPAALARLADALRLTRAERAYLFELTRRHDPAPRGSDPVGEAAPAELVAVIQATTAASYLLDPLWCARAWNDPAARLFAPWFKSGEPCLLRFVFLDPAARDFVWDWENRARRLIAEFRADTARDPEDAATRALVASLTRECPAFAQFWREQAVLARDGGTRKFVHPKDGLVAYEQVTLLPAAHAGWKMVMLLARAG